ncbi:MAG: IS630 family transposase [Planctomycetes bacterium]|nr:IS630 family transposase [Planctomycetota bacterium]
MERNPTAWRRREKEAFRRRLSRITDAATRLRFLAILHTAEGYSQAQIAETLACSPRTVARVRQRFRQQGIEGLLDRRGDNGTAKVTADYVLALTDAVRGSPQDYDYPRPTWTQELLVTVMAEQTGIQISVATMSRLLGPLGVRRGRPKPTVGCPWSKHVRTRRLGLIRRLIETLGPDEVAVYEDEVDIDLNPKIGPDYMLPGQQKTVVTPGQNVKHYVAGALDARTDRVIWADGPRKNGALFIALLARLSRMYADRRAIHVILDNYGIHSSKAAHKALRAYGGRLVLHFLPPYCPDDNRIERCLWREVHANVTRNHRCATMAELMQAFRKYLATRNRKAAAKRRRAA